MGTTFTVDASTANTLVTHAYNAPGTFRVGVKYMDNDGQWSQPYPFTITIREVRRVFYVKDHLGNIRQSLNESGTVVSAQDYYPYGETLRGYISVHPYEKYRFTEKERDIKTNLDYFGARYYDSQLGIWGQVDPLWEKYHGWSTYNYTLNNPLKYVDPDGLEIRGKDKEDAEEAAKLINKGFEDKEITNYKAIVEKRTIDDEDKYFVILEGEGSFNSKDPKLNAYDNSNADAGFEALKSVIQSETTFTFHYTDNIPWGGKEASVSSGFGGGKCVGNAFYVSPQGNKSGTEGSNNRWGESPVGIFFHEVVHLNKNNLRSFSPHPNNANKMNRVFNYNKPGPHK